MKWTQMAQVRVQPHVCDGDSLVSLSNMACLHQLHVNFSGMTAPVNE